MKQKQTIIAVFFATVLLLASGNCYSAEPETKAALASEEFIFTFWPVNFGGCYAPELQMLDDMMSTNIGMTYAGISFRPNSITDPIRPVGPCLTEIKSKYKVALEISAGHYDSNGGLPELVDRDELGNYLNTDNGKQFLKAPCLIRQDIPKDECEALGCTFSEGKCQNCPITNTIANNWSYYVDKGKCENWNNPNLAIDPSYTGTLWENTVKNTGDIIKTANPDIVLFDCEYWQNPTRALIEYHFTRGDTDCDCNIVKDGIGYDNYYDSWEERYSELRGLVKNVNQSTEVYFFGDIKAGGETCRQNFNGEYGCSDSDYLSEEAGDYPNPNYYFLPNLELLEKNTANGLSGDVPWVSFVYMNGHSNYFEQYYAVSDARGDIRFDTSVSREAGRMLRQAGARGFMVYPNKYMYGGYGEYWANHAREMIAGFLEEGYIEKNKIKNPGFESWKTKSDSTGYDGRTPARLENERFIPVFWSWSDTSAGYNDSGVYADLTTNKQSGMYSWRHTRTGDPGTRAIYSREFSIAGSEAGNYRLSIQTKASINNSNGKIEFYLVNTNTLEEQPLGETGFATDWKEFKQYANMEVGDYNLKIILNDQTGQTADVFLDTVSFEKATACGNGECETELGETFETCPQDCTQECVDTPTLMTWYIPRWKRGEISMLTLMQKIRQRNTGAGC